LLRASLLSRLPPKHFLAIACCSVPSSHSSCVHRQETRLPHAFVADLFPLFFERCYNMREMMRRRQQQLTSIVV